MPKRKGFSILVPLSQQPRTHPQSILSFLPKNNSSQEKWDIMIGSKFKLMNSLLPNADLKRRKWGKPLENSGMT